MRKEKLLKGFLGKLLFIFTYCFAKNHSGFWLHKAFWLAYNGTELSVFCLV